MQNLRLRPAIAIVLLLGFFFPVLFAGWQTFSHQRQVLLEELQKEHGRILDILVLGIREPLWSLYPEAGLPLVNAVMTDKRIKLIRIVNEDGEVFLQKKSEETDNQELLSLEKKVFFHGREIGSVTVDLDSSYIRQTADEQMTRYLIIFLIPFLASLVVLFFLLQKKIIIPLDILIGQSENIANKDLNKPFLWHQRDEIGRLGQSLEQTRLALFSAFEELEEMNTKAVNYSKELEKINLQLQNEIEDRIQAEEKLRDHKSILEKTVKDRTFELVETNEKLLKEIEERKRAEEERSRVVEKLHRAEKMEALGILASGVAHDLNNILAGIVSYPEILLADLDPASELYTALAEIQESGKRAVAVVADLLTIARSAATVRSVHNINELAQEYFKSPEYVLLKEKYQQIEISFQWQAKDTQITCSPVHVKKCLMNLVTNAVEAMANGGEICISTSNITTQEGRFTVLTVCDNGPGITEKDRERIFEPFYTTKQMGLSGSGLGLAVVWNTMQEHNGWVSVESDAEGTCFHLHFPSRMMVEQKILPKKDRVKCPFGNGELLLVVDDEELLVTIAGRMLTKLGYQVISAPSGEEAIEIIKHKRVDGVVLDMVMDPGLNGRETFEQMQKIQPDLKAMIVSGFSMNEDIKSALDQGVATFLKKPYSMEELGLAVHLTLKG